ARCAYCGSRVRGVGNIIERAVDRAFRKHARVEVVTEEACAALKKVGGIGAFLKTRTGSLEGINIFDIAPAGQEGWLRDQENVAKPPLSRRRGGGSSSKTFLVLNHHPVRSIKGSFAIFLLMSR